MNLKSEIIKSEKIDNFRIKFSLGTQIESI
jgi:hypothetical protein